MPSWRPSKGHVGPPWSNLCPPTSLPRMPPKAPKGNTLFPNRVLLEGSNRAKRTTEESHGGDGEPGIAPRDSLPAAFSPKTSSQFMQESCSRLSAGYMALHVLVLAYGSCPIRTPSPHDPCARTQIVRVRIVPGAFRVCRLEDGVSRGQTVVRPPGPYKVHSVCAGSRMLRLGARQWCVRELNLCVFTWVLSPVS